MVQDVDRVSSKDALAPAAAPDSLVARYGLLTLKGIGDLPAGVFHAGREALAHPLHTLEIAGTGALTGAALKTLLPETGEAGKIAGMAIGAYFAYKGFNEFVQPYKDAGKARTMNEIDLAAARLGDAGGSFLVNSAIAGAGAKLGAAGADRVLLRPELDGFADLKQAFWDAAGSKAGKLADAIGMTTPAEPVGRSASLLSRPCSGDSSHFAPAKESAQDGIFKGSVPANEDMELTIRMKSRSSDLAMDRALKRLTLGRANPMTDEEFTEKFGASQESLDTVGKFAQENGLTVRHSDLGSGRVVLAGSADRVANAFQTKLNKYELNGQEFIRHEGALNVPKELSGKIQGVFGLDENPRARAQAVGLEDLLKALLQQMQGRMPGEIADAYNFPSGLTGRGQGVAIIQLGGGIDMQNEAAYYREHGLKMPEITVKNIDGASSWIGTDSKADAEVSIDSQIVGTVAPDARQTIIFAPNTHRGFLDAITDATFPGPYEQQNNAISISWAGPIYGWDAAERQGMSFVFRAAALKGMSVFAASGDLGASPNGITGVYYPAADPYVTAVGGTNAIFENGKITGESVWNSAGQTPGGGFSPDPAPDYQKALYGGNVPGRAIPDISALASGYKIRVAGVEMGEGGTSAAAPLMASLAVKLNEGLGRPIGFMNPFLYKNGFNGTGFFFNDVTSGSNGYNATPGWDPATGWGSVDGFKIFLAYIADPNASSYTSETLSSMDSYTRPNGSQM